MQAWMDIQTGDVGMNCFNLQLFKDALMALGITISAPQEAETAGAEAMSGCWLWRPSLFLRALYRRTESIFCN